MQTHPWQHTAAATLTGTLVGIYKTVNAGSLVQSVLLTALSAAVSCFVSFCLQRLLKRRKR